MTELSDERRELEDTIYENLREVRKRMLDTSERLRLVLNNMDRDAEGSARVVPEDLTLQQDMRQIASNVADVEGDIEARMEDLENLMDLIEKEREE